MQVYQYFLNYESFCLVSVSTSFGLASIWAAVILSGLLVLLALFLAIWQIRRSSCSPSRLSRLIYETILSRSIYSYRLPAFKTWQRAFRHCRDVDCVVTVANEVIVNCVDPHSYLERDTAIGVAGFDSDDLQGCSEAQLLSSTVGYLRIERFTEGVSRCVERQLRRISSVQSLIIDLRGNRGGGVLESFQTASLFLRRGTLAHFERRIPGSSTGMTKYTIELSDSGIVQSRLVVEEFAGMKACAKEEQVLSPRLRLWRVGQLLVLLVDRGSASAAELFAGALKDNLAAVIAGKPTYGKGVGQSHITLSGEIALNVTTFKYSTPGGFWPGDGTNPGSGLIPTIAIAAQEGTETSWGCPGHSTVGLCDQAVQEVMKTISRF